MLLSLSVLRSQPQPIIVITSLTGSSAAISGSLGFGANDLIELGLRLAAVDRSGLGKSDAHPTKTLSSWVADIRELIQANHLRKVAAVGFSQGAPFAFALAKA